MKKLLALLACALVVSCLAGCAGASNGENDYADEKAMEIIAKGWEKRSDMVNSLTGLEDNYNELLRNAVQAEYDNDAVLKDMKFQNTQMQEDVLAYLNAVDGQLKALDDYSSDSLEHYEAWNKALDQRTILVKKFADEYGMTVSAKYEKDFEEFLKADKEATNKSNQEAAINEMIAAATWEPVDEGFGIREYVAIVENTSEYNYENVSLWIGYYDADDIKSETSAYAQNWNKGEKIKFEAYTGETEVQRIEATVDYFEVAE